VSGADELAPDSSSSGTGPVFDVTLKPGGSFDKVRVEWQDHKGNWHR
jgi:hypothetical protein